MGANDQALLQQWVHDRDAEAFRMLAMRHAAMVYNTSRRILRDPTDAEDVAQECFEALVRAGDKPGAYLGAWLHRVATNLSCTRIEAKRHRQDREDRFAANATPATESYDEDLYAHVDKAIAALPDKLRYPLVAHFLENQTHDAIAESIGVSRQTITYRIGQAVERVRSALKRRGVMVAAAAFSEFLLANSSEAVPSRLAANLGKLAVAAGPPAQAVVVGGAALAMNKILLVAIASVAGLMLLARVENWAPWKLVGRNDAAVQSTGKTIADLPSPAAGSAAGPPKSTSTDQQSYGRKSAPAAGVEASQGNAFVDAMLQGLQKKPLPGFDTEPARSADLPENNAAHFFLLAAELLPDIDNRLYELLDMARAGTPIDPAELAAYVEKCRDSLAAMRAGLDVKNCRMPEVSGGEPLPYFEKFRTLGYLMDLQALSAIQQGDPGAACNAWSELLQFSNETTRGACLNGRSSGNAMARLASYDIRTAVMAGAIPSEQLAAFLHTAEDIEAQRVPFSETMAVDNEPTLAWYESLLRDPEKFRTIMTLPECHTDPAVAMAMAAVPAEQLQIQLSEAVQAFRTCSEYVSMPYYEFKRAYQEPPVQNIFTQWLLGQIQHAPASEAFENAGRTGMLMVGALQLYHDQHGQWPESLNALAPAFLKQVPQDPFTGEPFKYQVRPDGVSLYSVGANLQDDGGTLNKYNAPDGDLIIWPATP